MRSLSRLAAVLLLVFPLTACKRPCEARPVTFVLPSLPTSPRLEGVTQGDLLGGGDRMTVTVCTPGVLSFGARSTSVNAPPARIAVTAGGEVLQELGLSGETRQVRVSIPAGTEVQVRLLNDGQGGSGDVNASLFAVRVSESTEGATPARE